MSQKFLDTVMHFTSTITRAERSLAVDTDLNVQGMINLDEDTIQQEKFMSLAKSAIHEALEKNEAIITNNVVTDPSEAPTTNTNYSDLRVIVTIPVGDMGAVYVDQHIRQGIIARETIEKIHQIIKDAIVQGDLDLETATLTARYEQIG